MELEQTKTKSTEKSNTRFSISNIMGLGDKDIEKDYKDTSEKKDNQSPKYTTTLKSTEKAKRLSDDTGSKRYRATFDKAQIFHMERVFLINHYPDVAARFQLSKATALLESQVQIWFQNRRAKWRKQQRKRRQDIPPIFGLGYPTHLARQYPGYDPYGIFPYEYYNTDFWTCAQQQIAAMHYTGLAAPALSTACITSPAGSGESSSPISSPASSPSSPINQSFANFKERSPDFTSDKALEIRRNDSSLLSLRMKAREHLVSLETSVTS